MQRIIRSEEEKAALIARFEQGGTTAREVLPGTGSGLPELPGLAAQGRRAAGAEAGVPAAGLHRTGAAARRGRSGGRTRPGRRRGGALLPVRGTAMILTHSLKVCLAVEPCDLRKSFDSLAAVVRLALGEDPLSRKVFVFANRSARPQARPCRGTDDRSCSGRCRPGGPPRAGSALRRCGMDRPGSGRLRRGRHVR